MEQIGRGKKGTRGDPEIVPNVLVGGIVEEGRMTGGITLVLVHPGIERGEVVVAEVLMVARVHVQSDGIGSTAEKSVSGI